MKSSILDRTSRELKRWRRRLYDLRAHIPGMQFHHQCELMVGPVGYWNALQRYQFNALKANGLQPHHTLLDLGCGPLQGGIAFIRYLEPGHYVGVDINQTHIEAASRQLTRHDLTGKSPRLIHSESYGDEQLGETRFDFIFASQILYYFDDKQMSEVLAFARRRLKPDGKFLGDIVDPEQYNALFYPKCGFLYQTVESMQRMAESAGMRVRSLGKILQYGYPPKLSMRSDLMLEFTRIS